MKIPLLPPREEVYFSRGSCNTSLSSVEAVAHREAGALDAATARTWLQNPTSTRNTTSSSRLSKPYSKQGQRNRRGWRLPEEGNLTYYDKQPHRRNLTRQRQMVFRDKSVPQHRLASTTNVNRRKETIGDKEPEFMLSRRQAVSQGQRRHLAVVCLHLWERHGAMPKHIVE